MSRDQGMKGAVRAHLVGAAGDIQDARAKAEGEQLALLPIVTQFSGARGRQQRGKVEVFERARGVGRPAKSENLMTRDIKRLLAAHGFDPVLWQFGWARHTPESLAKELCCTRLEAFDRLAVLVRDLRKIFYADAPPTDDDGKPIPQFSMTVIGDKVAVVSDTGAPMPPWMRDPEVFEALKKAQQKHGVSEPAEAKSNEPKSNNEPSN